MASPSKPTIAQAVAQALSDVDRPIATKAFIDKVLAIRPSSAKNPAASIRNHLKWEANGKSIAYLDRKTLIPLRVAMRGVRLCIPLTRQEVRRGVLLTIPALSGFFDLAAKEPVEWLDQEGNVLTAPPTAIVQKQATLQKTYTYELPGVDLGDWMKAQRARQDDYVLVTVESWEPRRFRIELESQKSYRKHRDEVEQKNQELADILYDALERARDERLWVSQIIPAAYVRLFNPRGYPGDHWIEVVEQDPRMRFDGTWITYADHYSPLEAALGLQETPIREKRLSPEQKQQVYRFKTSFRHRRSLWRRIEIQGEQTLEAFDRALRSAFEHDTWDHMSGFWRLVRRGRGTRYREIDLGNINPLGEGDAAGIAIGSLDLEPGNKLRYVYDFGDWIEHEIELEAIVSPDQDSEYPRLAAQNEPRYRTCESCQAKGKETIATWICIECSNRQDRDVLVCGDCLLMEHEGHYADEILY